MINAIDCRRKRNCIRESGRLFRLASRSQPRFGFALRRTNIHSCDFSSDSYTYAQPGDKDLVHFSIDHDRRYRIPFIKAALAAAPQPFKLFASPWSPPEWMKTNGSMLHGGQLKPEFAETWATTASRPCMPTREAAR
jgi:O-glycosyl hydrolase